MPALPTRLILLSAFVVSPWAAGCAGEELAAGPRAHVAVADSLPADGTQDVLAQQDAALDIVADGAWSDVDPLGVVDGFGDGPDVVAGDAGGDGAPADTAAAGDTPAADAAVEDAAAADTAVGDAPTADSLLADLPPCEASGSETCNGLDDDCDGLTDEQTCDDANVCTFDVCQGGVCAHAFAGGPCDDGLPCTVAEACDAGVCVLPAGWVVTLAGGGAGFKDGAGAKFSFPGGLTLLPGGAAAVADTGNNRIRLVNQAGVVATLAGEGVAGWLDGAPQTARFSSPAAVALAASGTLVVADAGNHRLRAVDPAGVVSTLAGGPAGFADGVGAVARFQAPVGVATGPGDVVWIADRDNHRIRRLTGQGAVSTAAGGAKGFADGPGAIARFHKPAGVASDGDGQVYIADSGNRRIRRLSVAGQVVTVAGSGQAGWGDGPALQAQFVLPEGLATGPNGRLFVADRGSHRLRVLELAGQVGTLAGSGVPGYVVGPPQQASFLSPGGLAIRPTGEVVLADRGNHRLRAIVDNAPGCQISGLCWGATLPNPAAPCAACQPANSAKTWSLLPAGAWCVDGDPCTGADACKNGQCAGALVTCDDGDACTADACLQPTGTCQHVDVVGCGGKCLTDSDCNGNNPCVSPGASCQAGLCVDSGSDQVATLTGTIQGDKDGPPGVARLADPAGLQYAGDGDLVFADRGNHRIRQVDPAGVVSTLAGSGSPGNVDGVAQAATFKQPADVATAPGGVVWIADGGNHRIRRLTASGAVTTFAGAAAGFADGKGAAAQFSGPRGIVRTSGGVLYVADTDNHRVRKVLASGAASTLAGGPAGHVNGPGHLARFKRPWALALDAAGNLLVADRDNHYLRRVTPEGAVSDLVGTGVAGSQDGPLVGAQLNAPVAVAVDGVGRIFLGCAADHRVRTLLAGGPLSSLAGTGSPGWLDGSAAKATFNGPVGLAVDRHGLIAVADAANHRLRTIWRGDGACQIGGVCWAAGTPAPASPCLTCQSGDSWQPVAAALPCDDGLLCTGMASCQAGKCGGALAKGCDDADPCTKDSCEVGSGACQHAKIPGCGGWCEVDLHCQDANPCLLGEACVDHKCDVSAPSQVDTPAGGVVGWQDGPAALARFKGPTGMDFAGAGDLWLADSGNHVVRRLDSKGQVHSVAGSGSAGHADGFGKAAAFAEPSDVAVLPDGQVLVADALNHRLRRVTPLGKVSTWSGGEPDWLDGPAAVARFNRPRGLAVTPGGVVYVADALNHRIRKILPDGQVSTLAGSVAGHKNGVGAQARFNRPMDVAVDVWGAVFVADRDNHRVRRITPDGAVLDLAGSLLGFADGPGATARFHLPRALAVDGRGWVAVADAFNNRIRMIDAQGVVSSFAGAGLPDWLDGAASKARFQLPGGVAFDGQGWLWVADTANNRLRRVRDSLGSCFIGGKCLAPGLPKGPTACEFCGPATALGWSTALNGTSCGDDGPCTQPGACLAGYCIAGAAKPCNDGDGCTADSCEASSGACVYKPIVGCAGNCVVAGDCDDGNPCTIGHGCIGGKCSGPAGVRTTTLAGGKAGYADGPVAAFNGLRGVAEDGQGGWYVADAGNHRVRRWLKGVVGTVAGSGVQGFKDGPAAQAALSAPADVLRGVNGGVWIADTGNHAIRFLDGAGQVSLVAGTGLAGSQDGLGAAAAFNGPTGLAHAATGAVWVADRDNHRVRLVAAAGGVSTVAGGLPGYVDGPVSEARFQAPEAVARGPLGRLWIADTGNHRLRRLEPSGVVITVAGLGVAGGVDGPAAKSLLAQPAGLAIDDGGTVWISDRLTHRVRRLLNGDVTTVAGWAAGFSDGDDTTSRFDQPVGLAVDASGTVAVADWGNHRLRRIRPSAGSCLVAGVCLAPGLCPAP